MLSKYDAFKLASESSVSDTDRVIEQAEGSPIDTIKDALGIQGMYESRNDPDAVDRLKNMHDSEVLVRPEWKTLQHMENIGYPTKEALVFLESLYRLEASRFRAEYQGNGTQESPHRLGEFTGRERLMEMYYELSVLTVNPRKSVAKPVEHGFSEIPTYILQTASKLWIEGLRGNEERMKKASQGLSAFAVWRGIQQKADMSEGLDGQTIIDMTSEEDVELMNQNKKRNIFMEHYHESLRNYSTDDKAHKLFIKELETMIAQQFALNELEV